MGNNVCGFAKNIFIRFALSRASNIFSPRGSYCISRGGGSVFTVVNV